MMCLAGDFFDEIFARLLGLFNEGLHGMSGIDAKDDIDVLLQTLMDEGLQLCLILIQKHLCVLEEVFEFTFLVYLGILIDQCLVVSTPYILRFNLLSHFFVDNFVHLRRRRSICFSLLCESSL